MDDDRTTQPSNFFSLTVEADEGVLYPGDLQFIHSFRIGRSEGCEVRCYDRSVSRVHLDVLFESGHWWVQDHQSRNGTFVDAEKIHRLCITDSCQVKLGNNGPTVSLLVETLLGTPTDFPSFPNFDSTLISHTMSNFSSNTPVAKASCDVDEFDKKSAEFENPACVNDKEILAGPVDDANISSVISSLDGQSSSLLKAHVHSCIQESNVLPSDTPDKLFRFARRKPQESATEIFRKVLREESGSGAGPSTGVIRIALDQAFQQRSRRYRMFLGGIALLAVVFGVVA